MLVSVRSSHITSSSMLNDQQYKRLLPHRNKLQAVNNGHAISGNEPFNDCIAIHHELKLPPFNHNCGACVAEFYINLFKLILKYEQHDTH